MEKRVTNFSKLVHSECFVFDIQGVCINQEPLESIVVEAIDMQDDPVENYILEFSERELYVKACFGEKLNANFVLLLHKKYSNNHAIHVKYFKPNHVSKKAIVIKELVLSEQEFIAWWKNHQQYKQKKQYRIDMQKEILESYFDQLLETNDSSWTLNIDGYIATEINNELKIIALIEDRYSNKSMLHNYDPNNFFYADKKAWKSLKLLSEIMGIPLFLCTYSRYKGCESQIGITRIDDVQEYGLIYGNNLKPCDNIYEDINELKKWLSLNCKIN